VYGTALQFLGFALVGAIGTAVHYAVLVLGVALFGIGPVIASSCGAVLGAVTNYLLNYRFTFRSKKAHSEALVKFFVVAAVGLGINAALVDVVIRFFAAHYLVAQVIATAAVLFWGFVANRIWTFKEESRARISM
jgi:putative flippase GtrA